MHAITLFTEHIAPESPPVLSLSIGGFGFFVTGLCVVSSGLSWATLNPAHDTGFYHDEGFWRETVIWYIRGWWSTAV